MIRWYKLIKWVKKQKNKGFLSFRVVISQNEFIIWNPDNDEEIRINL